MKIAEVECFPQTMRTGPNANRVKQNKTKSRMTREGEILSRKSRRVGERYACVCEYIKKLPTKASE